MITIVCIYCSLLLILLLFKFLKLKPKDNDNFCIIITDYNNLHHIKASDLILSLFLSKNYNLSFIII